MSKALSDLFSVDRLGDLSSKKQHLEKSIIIIRPSYSDMKSNAYCLVCCFQLNRRSVKVMFMQIRFYILRSIRQFPTLFFVPFYIENLCIFVFKKPPHHTSLASHGSTSGTTYLATPNWLRIMPYHQYLLQSDNKELLNFEFLR